MPVARWKVKRMKLIKLEDGNAFYHKKLICIGRSAAYINELCRRYPVLERIEAVVDGDSRNQGEMVFSGKKILFLLPEHFRIKENSCQRPYIFKAGRFIRQAVVNNRRLLQRAL